MTLFLHELRQGKIALAIWSLAIAFFMVVCVLIYPEMGADLEDMGEMFASMGAFTEAFGMDQLNFGTFMGYYCIECGNVIGLGGAFFAALVGIGAISKEEKDHTAEFLLTHPVNRTCILTSKLAAVITQVVVLNVVVVGFTALSTLLVDIDIVWKEVMLVNGAYFLMQLEIALICFGISAFIRKGGLGIGLGLAVTLYFMNLVKNISDDAQFLKYITPYGYTDGAQIVADQVLDFKLVLIGLAYSVIAVAIGYWKYSKKDIA